MAEKKTGRYAQVVKKDGPLELVTREVPDPGPGQVRVRVQVCGVCHSDSITMYGLFPGIEYWATYITKLYNEEFHLLARQEIKTLADLANQKVNVDSRGAGTEITAARLLLCPNRFWTICVEPPIRIVTAIVSPIARPRPSIAPPTIPERQ